MSKTHYPTHDNRYFADRRVVAGAIRPHTAMYHWCFVPLTLGLLVLIAVMESMWYRTGDARWLRTTKFWMRLFGVNFAVGVATGLVLEFEFGTNWFNYSPLRGRHLRAPLAIEASWPSFSKPPSWPSCSSAGTA